MASPVSQYYSSALGSASNSSSPNPAGSTAGGSRSAASPAPGTGSGGAPDYRRSVFLTGQVVLATNSGAKKLFWPARICGAMSSLAASVRPNMDRMSLLKPNKGRDAVYLVEYIYNRKTTNIGWASWDDIQPLNDENANRLYNRQKFPGKYNKGEFLKSVELAKQEDRVSAPSDYTGLVGTPFDDGVTLGAAVSGYLFQKDDFVTLKDTATESSGKNGLSTVFLIHYFCQNPDSTEMTAKTISVICSELACLPERRTGLGSSAWKVVGAIKRGTRVLLSSLRSVENAFNVSTKKGQEQMCQSKEMILYDYETPLLEIDLDLSSTQATNFVVNPSCDIKRQQLKERVESLERPLVPHVKEAAHAFCGEGQIVEAAVAVRAHEDQTCVLCGCKSPIWMEDYDLDLGPLIGYARGRLYNGHIGGLPVADPYLRELFSTLQEETRPVDMNPDFVRVVWMHCYCFHLGISTQPDVRTTGPECNLVSWIQANRLKFVGSEPYDKEPLALVTCGRSECRRRFHLPALLMYGWGVCGERCLKANRMHPFLKTLMDNDDPTLLARPPPEVDVPEGFVHGWVMGYNAPQGLFFVYLDEGSTLTVGEKHMTWMAPEAGHRASRLIDQRDIGRNVIISKKLSKFEERWISSTIATDNSGIARFEDNGLPSERAAEFDRLLQSSYTLSNVEISRMSTDKLSHLSLVRTFGAVGLTTSFTVTSYLEVFQRLYPGQEPSTAGSLAGKRARSDNEGAISPATSGTSKSKTISSDVKQNHSQPSSTSKGVSPLRRHDYGKNPRFPRGGYVEGGPGLVVAYSNCSKLILKQVNTHEAADSFTSPLAPGASTALTLKKLKQSGTTTAKGVARTKNAKAKKSSSSVNGEIAQTTVHSGVHNGSSTTRPPLSTDWHTVVDPAPRPIQTEWSSGSAPQHIAPSMASRPPSMSGNSFHRMNYSSGLSPRYDEWSNSNHADDLSHDNIEEVPGSSALTGNQLPAHW
eukprot:gb/GECG01014267.1/.p1 GENE.gb/GECG01014267.1/~~gb/GECG01014267.1/.p1  ORF type:complete len:982 (+),score=103.36 gb/GECG01014267.1/:1-2946(+)